MATKRAVFVLGPTAVGKTNLAMALSQTLPIEIISVDSALIYRDLDIGSAKPSIYQRQLVAHHLIDILSPLENYSVAQFLTECKQLITEICARGKLPLLVGGTMMYYDALINGISLLPAADDNLRKRLTVEFKTYGNQAMHQRLAKLDPVTANKIAANDRQRIERALEVCYLSGQPMSLVQSLNKQPGLVDCQYLPLAILPANRNLLHERINLRFRQMLDQGLVAEVSYLQTKYPQLTLDHNSMRTVGYRQIWEYLAGKVSHATMLEQGVAATRQLAKRQITWLRSMQTMVIDDFNLTPAILLQKTVTAIEEWLNNYSS